MCFQFLGPRKITTKLGAQQNHWYTIPPFRITGILSFLGHSEFRGLRIPLFRITEIPSFWLPGTQFRRFRSTEILSLVRTFWVVGVCKFRPLTNNHWNSVIHRTFWVVGVRSSGILIPPLRITEDILSCWYTNSAVQNRDWPCSSRKPRSRPCIVLFLWSSPSSSSIIAMNLRVFLWRGNWACSKYLHW